MGNADGMSRRGNESDDYKTPGPCVRALLDNIKIPKNASILDPCSGNGIIGRILREYGFNNITEYDIKNGTNFHSETGSYDYIIMNSPYSDKKNFMFKAFTVAKGIFCILPQNVTNYNEFQSLFQDMPFFRGKYLMRPKFFMTAEETESPERGGVSAYSWFEWQTIAKEKDIHSYEKYINLNNYFKSRGKL